MMSLLLLLPGGCNFFLSFRGCRNDPLRNAIYAVVVEADDRHDPVVVVAERVWMFGKFSLPLRFSVRHYVMRGQRRGVRVRATTAKHGALES